MAPPTLHKLKRAKIALGIETSCDDTAVGIVRLEPSGCGTILANEKATQFDQHATYGGVVPEIAARSHVAHLDGIITKALSRARLAPQDIDLIAATGGPGLIGGVIVGLTTAKAMALSHDKPLHIVNHLEAHALSARLCEPVDFPFLLLLVSGGHTQLIDVSAVGTYRRIGTTIDDAAGEAFDKTAKLLGLGQPGGPAIERIAAAGDPQRFALPAPLKRRPGADFSFSGLKTAVRLIADSFAGDPHDAPDKAQRHQDIADLAASFQAAAIDHLTTRVERAMTLSDAQNGAKTLVVAGGVAANRMMRTRLDAITRAASWRLAAPPIDLCADNGAMVAWAGLERFRVGETGCLHDALKIAPRARWPLAPPLPGREHGGGKKGPKA